MQGYSAQQHWLLSTPCLTSKSTLATEVILSTVWLSANMVLRKRLQKVVDIELSSYHLVKHGKQKMQQAHVQCGSDKAVITCSGLC